MKRKIGGRMLATWISGALFGISGSFLFAQNGIGVDRVDDEKPENSPSWTTHQDAARELCGGPVVKPGPGVFATHVVVMKLNGLLVRMPIDQAWDRAKSKAYADDIWTIAVCKSDVRPAPSEDTRDA